LNVRRRRLFISGNLEGGPAVWSAWSLSSLCSRILRRGDACPRRLPATNSSGGSARTERSSFTAYTGITGSPLVRRCVIAAMAAGTAFASVAFLGIASAPVASAAASAPAAAQCNPPAFPTGAGEEASCNIAVTNTVTSAGATSSTITATACLAAAGVLPPAGCTTTVTTSKQLVSSINQCNGIVDGGGSNVTCNVTFANDISSGTPTSGATVNQCNGSGTGGGTQPTTVCAPVASTTNATVTQCNGSGTGGGGSMRVKCNVTGAATALPVSINQCNGSANGGGSTVTCTTRFVNNFITSSPTPTSTSASPSGTGGSGTTGTPGAGGVTPVTPAGSGATGLTGSAPRAGGPTGPPTIVGTFGAVPFGAPQTGLGGASHSRDSNLLFAGALTLVGAGLALTVAIRRRRTLSAEDANETS